MSIVGQAAAILQFIHAAWI